jgi:hypothetical protein
MVLAAGAASAQNCNLGGSPNAVAANLKATIGDQVNGPCIASSIKQLGDSRHEPSAPVLTKFLDFRWPPEARQKQRRFVLEHDGESIYPAATALEQIGKNALPAVLDAMKAKSASREAIEVAVSVWMTIYKGNERAAVALLKQEAENSNDPPAKPRLLFAAYLAARDWCDASERPQCLAIAKTRAPDSTQRPMLK